MKFPKPGPKEKRKLSTKRVLKHNIDKPHKLHCRKCNATTGTEAYRHIETSRKHALGKGIGSKSNDKATAYLCSECDNILSNLRPDKDTNSVEYWKREEEWLWLVLLTWLIE